MIFFEAPAVSIRSVAATLSTSLQNCLLTAMDNMAECGQVEPHRHRLTHCAQCCWRRRSRGVEIGHCQPRTPPHRSRNQLARKNHASRPRLRSCRASCAIGVRETDGTQNETEILGATHKLSEGATETLLILWQQHAELQVQLTEAEDKPETQTRSILRLTMGFMFQPTSQRRPNGQ